MMPIRNKDPITIIDYTEDQQGQKVWLTAVYGGRSIRRNVTGDAFRRYTYEVAGLPGEFRSLWAAKDAIRAGIIEKVRAP